MSKYSGVCDFKDTLEIAFDNDFDKFMEATEGIIYKVYQVNGKTQGSITIKINEPADLIPYYPYVVAVEGFSKHPYKAHIELAKESELDSRIERYEKNLPDQTVEQWRKLTEDVLKDLHKTREELEKLYKKEKRKPKDEQRII